MKSRFIAAGLFLVSCLLLPASAFAQFTAVTGNIDDANGIPYAGGTISGALVPASGGPWTLSGNPYSGIVGSVTLDSTGSFTIQVGDNTQITPGGSQWLFTVRSASATIQPPLGTGPQTFQFTVTITGFTQDVTANIDAVPVPALTHITTGTGTVTNISTTGPIVGGPITTTGTISCPTCPTGTLAATQVAFGSGANTISGSPNFTYITGTNTLTAGVFQTLSANPAVVGVLRLAAAESVAWRNSTNSSNITLNAGSVAVGNIPADAIIGQTTFAASAFIANFAAVALTGEVRLDQGGAVCWRNTANSLDICISKSAGDVLLNNGAAFGTVTNVTASGPITSSGGATPNIACATCVTGPGGANTQVQYNDGGAFNGAAGITYIKATQDTLIQNDLGNAFNTNSGGALIATTADASGLTVITGSARLSSAGSVRFSTGATNNTSAVNLMSPSFEANVAGIKFDGTTSGSAIINVASVAGTPAQINLPTTTGTPGQVLSTDGGTPQQTSWITPSTTATSVPLSGITA